MAKKSRPSGKEAAELYKTGSIVQPGTNKRSRTPSEATVERGTASDCLDEIKRYDQAFDRFERRGKEITQRYRDERDQGVAGARSFNVLWSNVQILKPTLYAHAPKAEVVRRFKDQDPVGRIACEIAERATDVEIENVNLDAAIQNSVLDRLLPGRGQIWVSYNPSIKGEEDDRVKEDDGICVDYVDWRDFGHSVKATWQQVLKNGKVWRWKGFNREDFIEAFGEKYVEQVAFTERKPGDNTNQQEGEPEARVAEIWDAQTKRVYWACKSVPDYLDEYDDPLHLRGFFPCPRPMYGTLTPNRLDPVADFYLYQDQANEVDKLTGRINRLTDALKVTGIYDEGFKALETLMDPTGVADNTLVPVSMTDLTGKGGSLENVIQLVDLSKVIVTIEACYEARERALNTIYQITGISDILRGASDPRETLGAQEIKTQSGSTRIRDMQQDVARFSRDVVRIMAEIIAEMYSPLKLWTMTNAESFVGKDPQTGQPNVQLFAQAVKLLRDDKLRSYRVDIETDSTIALDEAQSKQEAVEFMTVVSGALEKSIPMATQIPASIPFIKESLLFLARRFKGGRGLETALEQMGDALQQQAQQPKPPSPEQMKAQADQTKLQGQLQIAQSKIKATEMMAQIKIAEGQQKMQLEREKAQLDAQIKVWEAQQELDQSRQEFAQNQFQRSADHQQSMAQSAQAAAQKQALAKQQPQGRA